jgi:hypothetical protein
VHPPLNAADPSPVTGEDLRGSSTQRNCLAKSMKSA